MRFARPVATRFVLLCLALAAAPAQAATPPIKPGLWQLHSSRVTQGGQSVDMAAQMKNLPPEARKRMEEIMKQKGMDIGSGDGSVKVCMSKESLDQGNWRGTQHGCTTQLKNTSASTWTWHAVCTDPPSESDGEAVFASPEAYTVKNRTTVTRGGKKQSMDTTVQAKWLGGDCGNLKPMSPGTMQAPPKGAPAAPR
jgi:hypothetical protein